VNTALASPLLSRFDLVFVLLDTQNKEWDRQVSEYILLGVRPAHGFFHFLCTILSRQSKESEELFQNMWPLDELQSYICHLKESFHPTLSPVAQRILSTYYQRQRSADSRDAGMSL
jgi:DNA helicase MCM9